MFALSKIVGLLVQPSSLALLAIAAGLVTSGSARFAHTGRRLAWGGLGLLTLAGIIPLGNVLILPLEQRFATVAPPSADDRVDGIIILGGFEDGWVSAGRGALTINEAGERLTESVRLARMFPTATIVFSGGVGSLLRQGADATGPVGRYLVEMGVAAERIVLEGRSRNTQENAVFTAALVKPTAGQRWLLVTSAYHMPRAVGVFRRAGMTVVPCPVDYRTRGPEDRTRLFDSVPAGLMRLDLAVKEWVGLFAYWMLGRTDAVLPG
ncbi:MAG: YdcF family protein [Hyphomicrobium sp.]